LTSRRRRGNVPSCWKTRCKLFCRASPSSETAAPWRLVACSASFDNNPTAGNGRGFFFGPGLPAKEKYEHKNPSKKGNAAQK
jgi:hypothetical protein